jgi:hypothetical protein
LKQGLIKKCPVDWKAINNLIYRTSTDLITAKRNINFDKECTYNYAYNAMLHSGLASMFSEGFRPEIKDKHLTIVKFISSELGGEFKQVINDYDFMRRIGIALFMSPIFPVQEKNLQIEFDFLKLDE